MLSQTKSCSVTGQSLCKNMHICASPSCQGCYRKPKPRKEQCQRWKRSRLWRHPANPILRIRFAGTKSFGSIPPDSDQDSWCRDQTTRVSMHVPLPHEHRAKAFVLLYKCHVNHYMFRSRKVYVTCATYHLDFGQHSGDLWSKMSDLAREERNQNLVQFKLII